jgi:hypothetical protein
MQAYQDTGLAYQGAGEFAYQVAPDAFVATLHHIEQGMVTITAAGLGGVLTE